MIGKRIGYVRQHASEVLMLFMPARPGSLLSAADSEVGR